MKPNARIPPETLKWAFLAAMVVLINSVHSIRVYEGTNIPAPSSKLQKVGGFNKKSLYISKRSWSGLDEDSKSDRRLDGKWKELTKRMTEAAPTLYKIKFQDNNFMQYLRYIKEIPRLEEYTFCLWYKPENLTHDQTLFSYSLNKNEILLRFWINAFDSTLRMSIRENTVYKVPANIRQRKWHHICQSWNGVLGEWQVFLEGKKIGAGVIPHYKGTYIPEGGEVTIGQDLTSLGKKLNDGMDGEVFGFNLVDESVPYDEGVFINSQYKPNVQGAVPPFKKLPQIKKTYQEIKAYISTLPVDPEGRKKNDALSDDSQNVPKKPPKRNRGNHRVRYPPLRKVVVYNRDDRQLTLEEESLELNKTKPQGTPRNETTVQRLPVQTEYNDSYSIHSYRLGKGEKKNPNYEIYEILEDEPAPPSEDQLTDRQLLERKARQNFNLYTARQANKVYTLSNTLKDAKKPRFHFETRAEERREPQEGANRRSFQVEEASPEADRKHSDGIPVYEVEISSARRKRSADGKRESRQFTTDDPLTDSNGFRRLPQIPDSFINLFAQNASRTEIQQKLEEFFPARNATGETNVVAESTLTPKTIPEFKQIPPAEDRTPTKASRPTFAPVLPVEGRQATVLGNAGPVSFPAIPEQYREFNPREKETIVPTRIELPAQRQEPVMERRKFEVSSGTDLVMRSYGECTTNRGSPIREKERVVLSWADTPVRIFGGAQVERARNECGHF